MAPKVLIHGSGAIGSIYAYLLLRSGCEVTAICRSNYEAAKNGGFHISSALYGSDIHIEPKVVRTPSEAAATGTTFDYVVVCCKALPESNTAEVIAPVIGDDEPTIVLIQNGIDIEDEYKTRFPNNRLLSCVAYLPVTQTSPGHISMGNMERLEIGLYPASDHEKSEARGRAEQFVNLLCSAGGNATYHADIQERRWTKLLLNASWNPMCALTMSRDVALLASTASTEEPSLAFTNVRAVMDEVVDIARALGYTSVDRDAVEGVMKIATARIGKQGIEPSMLVDALEMRRMEVEVILGNPVRTAKRLAVAVPRMEMLYVLAKALDEANRWRQPGKSVDGDDLKRKKEN
jgi:2-dehydropantoate 2-reductase